jgi:hypothetical protein
MTKHLTDKTQLYVSTAKVYKFASCNKITCSENNSGEHNPRSDMSIVIEF